MSRTRRTFITGAAAFSFAASRAPAFAQQRLTPIRIVVTPVTNYTGLLVARDKGWFEEQGLNVSWSPVAQTAIAVEATYGGSVEFAGGGVLEPMIARGNGLDMMLVVPSARIRPEAPDNSAIVVKASSAIQKPADLAGKRASVGLLNSINHIHFIEWMRRNGGDAKTVQLTEIPFPQMPDALMQDRLDAVWAVEPFFTILKKSGNVRVIGYPYQENIPNMDITAMFAKESWLKANPDAAKRFLRHQRFVRRHQVVKLSAHVRPAGRFLNASCFVDLIEPRVAISLQRSRELAQVCLRMFAFAIRRVGEPHCCWCRVSCGTIIANVGPQPAGFCFAVAWRQHRNRRVIRV